MVKLVSFVWLSLRIANNNPRMRVMSLSLTPREFVLCLLLDSLVVVAFPSSMYAVHLQFQVLETRQ
jgi:hypothetical protein